MSTNLSCFRRIIARHREAVQQPIAVSFFENSVYFTDDTKMIVGRLNVYETPPQVQTISTNYQHRLLDVVVTHPVLQSTGKSEVYVCPLKKKIERVHSHLRQIIRKSCIYGHLTKMAITAVDPPYPKTPCCTRTSLELLTIKVVHCGNFAFLAAVTFDQMTFIMNMNRIP